MGSQIIKQPNGLWARWSSTVDQIVGFDYTPEDYMAAALEREAHSTAMRVLRSAIALEAGGKPSAQFTVSWSEARRETLKRSESPEVRGWLSNIGRKRSAEGEPVPQPKSLELRRTPMTKNVIGVYRNGRPTAILFRFWEGDEWAWETTQDRSGRVRSGLSLLAAAREALRLKKGEADVQG